MSNKKICICGGGNVAHSLAAFLSASFEVTVFTRKPHLWNSVLQWNKIGDSIVYQSGKIRTSSDLSDISDNDIFIISVPRHCMSDMSKTLKDAIGSEKTVIFVPTPIEIIDIARMFDSSVSIVCIKRVPFISRTKDYGKSVEFSDIACNNDIALRCNNAAKCISTIKQLFPCDFRVCHTFYPLVFSNSNTVIHPSRLYELLNVNNGSYDEMPMFYSEWGDIASNICIDLDNECQQVYQKLTSGEFDDEYEPILAHYDVEDANQLTSKMRQIKSLSRIGSPWSKDSSGHYVPDFSSRYFVEDVEYGLKTLIDAGSRNGLSMTASNNVFNAIESRKNECSRK